MAEPSTYARNGNDGSITLSDNTGTPVTKVLDFDESGLKITGLMPKLQEVVHVQRRGKHVCTKRGKRKYASGSISFIMTSLVGNNDTAPGTALEFFVSQGAYDANINPLGTGRPEAVNILWKLEGSDFGDTYDERVLMNGCVITGIDPEEGDDYNKYTVTFDITGTVVFQNNTNIVTFQEP